jgi:hypothetical protein
MVIDYEATWTTTDGARMLGVYGWAYFTPDKIPTQRENGASTSFSNQIEYYIIQDRGGYNPATNQQLCRGTPYGEATIDGVLYEFRVCDRIGQPALTGNNVNFKQFFSIPKNTSAQRTSGIIDVTAHFNAWHAAGMYMDGPLYEVAMKIESYNCGSGTNDPSNFNGRGTGSVTRNIFTIGGNVDPNSHVLTTNVTPAGAGTITRSPNAASYGPGTQVTLTRPTSTDWVFSGWSGGGCTGTDTTCVVTMNQAITVTATYTRSPDANLVADGDFPGTSLPPTWTLNTGEGYGGSVATAAVSNNRATITITSVGENPWEPQLTQRGIELEQGKDYNLTFTAQSVGGARNMEVLVQRVGEGSTGWNTYASEVFALTTASQNFSLPFEMTLPSDPSAQLAFNLGGSTNNVIISNVQLVVATGSVSIKPVQTTVRAHTPLVTVRAKTLTVNESPETNVQIRVVNLTGRTVASFNTRGGARLSLEKIPAGMYVVEAKRVRDGVRMRSNVVLR